MIASGACVPERRRAAVISAPSALDERVERHPHHLHLDGAPAATAVIRPMGSDLVHRSYRTAGSGVSSSRVQCRDGAPDGAPSHRPLGTGIVRARTGVPRPGA
jgi:hypothetical protein